MSLKERIQQATEDAMRARDSERLKTLRQVAAAIKQREIDERIELDDAQVLAALDRMAKQRRESIDQFEAAGRDDLVAAERAELAVIGEFMPEPLGEEELSTLIERTIAETGASGMQDMGAVMSALRGQVQGRADMKAVSEAVRGRLQGG